LDIYKVIDIFLYHEKVKLKTLVLLDIIISKSEKSLKEAK